MARGSVTSLWRFPVKSMQGETLAEGRLGVRGLGGDRRYAVVNPETGKVLTAKRYGELLMASARTEPTGAVVIALPDGTELAADDPAISSALSQWLDQPCRLAEVPAGDGAAEFEMSFDAEQPEHDLFSWPVMAGTFLDLAAVHLLTSASLDTARRLHPGGDWDVRRFRPTVLVDVDPSELGNGPAGGQDPAGFVEDTWVDSQVRLGQAVLSVFLPTVRCPMPSRLQPGLPRDLGVARTLHDHHENNLGVYASVTTPGVVAVGDLLASA